MNEYTVIDCRAAVISPEHTIKARSPEEAAMTALGQPLARGGHHRDLVCRVYWHNAGQKNMVRLYSKTAA